MYFLFVGLLWILAVWSQPFSSAPQMRSQGEVKGMSTDEAWWQQTRWQLKLFALASSFQTSRLVNNLSLWVFLCVPPLSAGAGELWTVAQQSSGPPLWRWIWTASNCSMSHNHPEHKKMSIWYVWINKNTAAFLSRDELCVSWNEILSVHALPACPPALETLRGGVGWRWGRDPSQLSSFYYIICKFSLAPLSKFCIFLLSKMDCLLTREGNKVFFCASPRLNPP